MRFTGRIAVVCIFVFIVIAWHVFYLLNDFQTGYAFLIEKQNYIWDFVFIPLLSPFFWWLGKQYDLAHFLSHRDYLTGLANRRYTYEYFRKCTRKNFNTIRLITADVNHFKSINDNWGHDTGDRILIDLSQIMMRFVSRTGLASRWGGDEFIILVRNVSHVDWSEMVSRLSAELNLVFAPFKEVEAGISLGTASYPEGAGTLDELIKLADIQLYERKNLTKSDPGS